MVLIFAQRVGSKGKPRTNEVSPQGPPLGLLLFAPPFLGKTISTEKEMRKEKDQNKVLVLTILTTLASVQNWQPQGDSNPCRQNENLVS